MAALQYDINIRRGETYRLPVRWETEPWVYAAISSINKGAPARIVTAEEHEIPDGWRVAVVDALGLTQLNTQNMPPRDSDMRRVTVVDGTTIEFNEVSTAAWNAHKPGTGFLAWRTPKDLTGYIARMQIRSRIGGPLLFSLTSDGDGINMDVAGRVIELFVGDSDAESFSWTSAVYDLEMVSAGGEVTALMAGSVTVSGEITVPII